MTNNTDLIARLRSAARHDSMFGDDVREHASEQAADALEAARAEIERLEQWHVQMADDRNSIASKLDKALARLAAIEKQEPVAEVENTKGNNAEAIWLDHSSALLDTGTKLYAAAGASPVQPSIATVVRSDIDIHLSHCFQPPYDTSCKYGDDDCPAMPKAVQPSQAGESRLLECTTRLVEHADFKLGGILSADSKAKDIPSNAVSSVKARHLAALRDCIAAINAKESGK